MNKGCCWGLRNGAFVQTLHSCLYSIYDCNKTASMLWWNRCKKNESSSELGPEVLMRTATLLLECTDTNTHNSNVSTTLLFFNLLPGCKVELLIPSLCSQFKYSSIPAGGSIRLVTFLGSLNPSKIVYKELAHSVFVSLTVDKRKSVALVTLILLRGICLSGLTRWDKR